MALKGYTAIDTVPFRGGAITVREKPLLPFGAFSMAQNVRPTHPGFTKRPGQRKQHSTADGTNKVLSLYQFRKSDVDEKHLYAQMGDGDLLEATNAPPAVTTGAFGSEAHDGSSGQCPASYAALNDILVYSNGADQHQVYGGDSSYVTKFVVYKGAAAPPTVPDKGEDYSDEVSDGRTTTVAVLDSLNTYANFHCFYIGVPVQAKSFTFTVAAANGNAATLACYYPKTDRTWAAVSGGSDGTSDDSKTLAQTGTLSFTMPTDITYAYMYGRVLYWYQFRVSAALDAEVEISSVTYDSAFQDLVNAWDGVPQYAIEVWTEGTSQYSTFAASAVSLDSFASGKKILLFCTDPIEGVYWDVGGNPNATGTTLTSFKYWDGDSMESVGTVTDESAGLSSSGWMTFPRQAAVQPVQYEGAQYYAYVYEVIFDSELSADVSVSVTVMPYFDVDELGNGQCCCAWKEHMVYSYDKWGEYAYVTDTNSLLSLNGDGFGILRAGDGRSNKILAMRKFYNELITWQEEKGVEGGCTTLFEGYSPPTYGKLLLSARVGIMNNNCAEVVEGVLTATATDEQLKTLAFWISRYGVCATDGRTVAVISDDIQNYFDPTKSECVRRGYESGHWLKYDSSCNCLLLGLVSGSSATVPNVFPVFDLTDKCWYFDERAQELSCMEEVEAGSGNVAVVQVGGGVDDGTVYQLNYGTNDVSTAIDSYIDVEYSGRGSYILIAQLLLRLKTQTAGNIALSAWLNNIAEISSLSLSMTAEVTNQIVRRHLLSVNLIDQHITVRVQHSTASQEACFEDIGVEAMLWERR